MLFLLKILVIVIVSLSIVFVFFCFAQLLLVAPRYTGRQHHGWANMSWAQIEALDVVYMQHQAGDVLSF
jgi:hypothetical protein